MYTLKVEGDVPEPLVRTGLGSLPRERLVQRQTSMCVRGVSESHSINWANEGDRCNFEKSGVGKRRGV